jgi:hypothetical protein
LREHDETKNKLTTFFSVLVFAGSSTASTPQPASQPSSVGTGNDTAGEATSLHSFTVFGAKRSSLGTAAAAEGADIAATSAAAGDVESGKASVTRPRSARVDRGSCQREAREVMSESVVRRVCKWGGGGAGGWEGSRSRQSGRRPSPGSARARRTCFSRRRDDAAPALAPSITT